MSLLLILLFISMIIGVPIFFSMGIASLTHTIANDVSVISLFQQIIRGVDSFTIVSVPLFILSANIMNESGITDRIFKFANCLVGHIRGGLAHANVLASLIFAGMSGSAIADAGGLGAIEIKAMRDNGFGSGFSAAITAASSIIGPIIPPSIPLVLYAASGNVSVGRLFLAGFFPGILMAVIQMIIIYSISIKRKYPSCERATIKQILISFRESFWALLSPVILLGGIFSGIFTPTEAAAISVVYSLIVAKLVYKDFDMKRLYQVLNESLQSTAIIGILIAFSFGLGYLLTLSQIPQQAVGLLTHITTNPIVILLILNVFFLIIGMFMDPSASILILTPILMPVIHQVGIDPVHFGIVMVLNLMIGMLTPPVGTCLYAVARVGKVKIESLINELLPFFASLVVVLLLLTSFPKLITFLPNLLMGGPG
jgi:tripartite ATP-independent transporter DctM subunit